jgi:hypothetical protein
MIQNTPRYKMQGHQESINCDFFITFDVNATFKYHIVAPANSFRISFGILSQIRISTIYWCALTKKGYTKVEQLW